MVGSSLDARRKPYEGTGQKPCFRTMRGVLPRATLCMTYSQPPKEPRMAPFRAPPPYRRQVIARGGTKNERRTTDDGRARSAQLARSQQGDTQGRLGPGRALVPPATVYRFGRRQIGHIHDTGVADLTFPREIHDELISDGRAKPQGAGFPAVVSYHIREPEDLPGAVELFRMSYDRAKVAAERRKESGPSAGTPTTSRAKEAPHR
jgi:hypothetical protein